MKSVPSSARRARRLVFWLSLSLLVAAGFAFGTHGERQIVSAQAAPADGKRAPFVPGRVLVRFRTDAQARAAEQSVAALATAGNTETQARVERFAGSDLVKGLRLVHVAPDATLQAVAALNERPDVLYAHPDHLRYLSRTPNDTRYSTLWGLKNTGQNILGSGTGLPGADIKAEQAWDITTGSNDVVVGVIDTGIDINHVDLAANIWHNPGEVAGNGVDDDGNGFVDDTTGWNFNPCTTQGAGANCGDNNVLGNGAIHGTHVAGTIGASGNNGAGVVGVNWQVKLMPLKIFLGNSTTTSAVINAYAYAKKMRDLWDTTGGAQGANLRVLNNSYGGPEFDLSERDGIIALNPKILFVVAAGNNGDSNDMSPEYPANYDAPNIISVASTTNTEDLSSFSNYGAQSVHIAAPGSSILSTIPNNAYDFLSGTSMATPHVSGAAALLLAAYPNMTTAQLRGALLFSGDLTTAASSTIYSHRRLNVYQALLSAGEQDTSAPAAPFNFRITAQTGRSISLAWTAPGDNGNTGQATLYELSFVDPNTNRRIFLGTQLPQSAGTGESATVTIPFRHATGQLTLKALDNVGNESATASVAVALDPALVDPYVPTESAPQSLTTDTSGALNFRFDDAFRTYNFPNGFSFPFYGQTYTTATISTNGILYFGGQPDSNDLPSLVSTFNNLRAVAGMWDDLRTDSTGGDVFVTQPAPDRLVFRWEGRTFNILTDADSGFPFKFEIELRTDGTIQMRYGSGTSGLNTMLHPVVGVSGGAPEAYVSATHTSDRSQVVIIALTNADTITYTPQSTTPPTVQFNSTGVSVDEAAGSVTLQVTRQGSTTSAATVGYQTIDNPAEIRCDDQLNNQGAAYARCDYSTAIDTIQFGAGEATKSITIPIIDDGHWEGAETFQVALVNPSAGLNLSAPATMTVTILPSDAPATPNPIFNTPFFVRQHYLDFLSREPEAGEPWSNVLNNCSDVNNNPNCDRLTVSAAFFGSPEFRLKGFYVFRFYRVAFNRLPQYAEIIPEMRQVTGATEAEVYAKKAAFSNAFTQRTEFATNYGGLSNAQYVSALLGRYNLTSITTTDPQNPDTGVKVTLTNAQLANQLTAGTLTRAQVLRAIADSDQVSGAEFNQAFVAMQYYGYLRRTPEPSGYQAWLNYLTANPSDFRTMVNGFMNSQEYRLRFGTAQ